MGVPVVFFQEACRRDLVDFGRELDGAGGVHLLKGDPGQRDRCPARRRRRRRRSQAPPLVLLRHRAEILLKGRRAYRHPDRWPHRHVRAPRLRRRPPARRLLPDRRGLRRRFEARGVRGAVRAMEYVQAVAVGSSAEVLTAFERLRSIPEREPSVALRSGSAPFDQLGEPLARAVVAQIGRAHDRRLHTGVGQGAEPGLVVVDRAGVHPRRIAVGTEVART